MKYLYFSESDKHIDVGLFSSESEIKKFLANFLDEKLLDRDLYEIELNREDFPEYLEININGNIFPITKYAFTPNEKIYIEIKELFDFTKVGNKIIDTYTIIENYAVPNDELKEYLQKRELAYNRTKKSLEKRGYIVDRAFQGSEDGEAIVIKNSNIYLFAHLDPYYVENLPEDEEEFEKFIEEQLGD